MFKKIKSVVLNYIFENFEEYKKLREGKELETIKNKFKNFGLNSRITLPILSNGLENVSIGNNFFAYGYLRIETFSEYLDDKFSPELIIGDNVNIEQYCHIGCINKVIIEDGVLIASRVYISDHYHGDTSSSNLRPAKRNLTSKGPVVIKKNVWIGEGAVIMPGVTIGENSIIGANAVVTKSFPDNSIIAGVPAKLIKTIN
ncbi:acyltransferase [Faecalibacter macacae]|uniref:Acyltransferase n=1 Tax=Faecalibacter macacae TaxID=1859289 RepID=A0A3L9MQ36_9FLAO|nr:acyltransferase [Faecalibacter macacae]RLZ12699.1 acyltransferase [Faecalibacter macacae]